eukprot:scpid107044/ scgid31863/ 
MSLALFLLFVFTVLCPKKPDVTNVSRFTALTLSAESTLVHYYFSATLFCATHSWFQHAPTMVPAPLHATHGFIQLQSAGLQIHENQKIPVAQPLLLIPVCVCVC